MANKGVAYTLSCVLAVAVAAGGYGLTIKPKMEAAEQLKASITQEQSYRDTMVGLQERTQLVSSEMEKITSEAAQFNSAFPSASDQAGLLNALNTVASKAGVTIKTVTPSAAVELEQVVQDEQSRLDELNEETGLQETADGDPRYTYMNLSLNITGKSSQHRDFLKALEGMDRKLYIQSVSSTTKDSGGTGDLSVSLVAMITAPLEDPTKQEATSEDAAAAEGQEQPEGGQ